MVKVALAVGFVVLFASGCFKPPVARGATPLIPAQTADSPSVWVFIDSDDEAARGVFRCSENGSQVVCRRAMLAQ